jgi:hypothetical protein
MKFEQAPKGPNSFESTELRDGWTDISNGLHALLKDKPMPKTILWRLGEIREKLLKEERSSGGAERWSHTRKNIRENIQTIASMIALEFGEKTRSQEEWVQDFYEFSDDVGGVAARRTRHERF